MRIRSIKPEFWRSEDISNLEVEDRLLFIGLWSYVDDNGVGRDRLAAVAADLFADDLARDARETLARVARGLQRLYSAGLIDRYEAEGKPYLYVLGWSKHQRVDRPNIPRFPVPIRDSRDSRESVATDAANSLTGTEEQRNRGTEEQSIKNSLSEVPPDAVKLCELLADLIERNGSKRPVVTAKAWLNEARLLLEKDQRPVDEAFALLRWCQADSFWKTNILSMSKFRSKYDQLRLKWSATGAGVAPKPRHVFGRSADVD